MREKLFGFQEDALSDLHKRINSANSMLLSDAEEQVIISFSAPTGSGKTIVMTALFEDIFFGSAETQGDPDAIIVWLSDMPELNEQSRRKIESKSDKIRVRNIHTIDSVFDSETLECGNIYFLNTQKLGSDKLLTHKSDKRQYTIWETLTNTVREYKDKLYLVIDEAHRGTNVSAKAENAAKSIMQKFIMGSAPDGLCKMPLVIGVTATPQRFHKLIENTESPELKVIIKPEDVRDSGLLKDRVVIHYPEIAINADMTMFQGAVASWQRKAEQWAQYCEKEREDMLNAIQQGIFTASTKQRLEDLEKQKEELEISITTAEIQKPKLTREYMEHWFSLFRFGNPEDREFQKRLVDTFVNAVFVYDDKLVLTYNYQHGTQTITLKEVEDFLGSDLVGLSPPYHKPAEMLVFPLFMRVFSVLSLCKSCCFLRYFCV